MRQFAVIALLACLSTPAFAIYKCQIDGKTVYRDQPCAVGNAFETPAMPANHDARQRLAQDQAKADRLERERHKREALEAREQRQAAKSAAARKKKCDNLALRKKWADEDVAKSTGKARNRAQIKSRRLAEQQAQVCS